MQSFLIIWAVRSKIELRPILYECLDMRQYSRGFESSEIRDFLDREFFREKMERLFISRRLRSKGVK